MDEARGTVDLSLIEPAAESFDDSSREFLHTKGCLLVSRTINEQRAARQRGYLVERKDLSVPVQRRAESTELILDLTTVPM